MSGTLRQHMAALHPRLVAARSNADLARQHGRDHHHRATSHWHEEDNAGNLVGPGSDRRRPSGWVTGLGVVMRDGSAPPPPVLTPGQARILAAVRAAGCKVYNGRAHRQIDALERLGLVWVEWDSVPHAKGSGMYLTERITVRPARQADTVDVTAWTVAAALVARLGEGAEAYAATTPALEGGAR